MKIKITTSDDPGVESFWAELIKIWSKKRGVIYDAVEDGSRTSQDKVAQEKNAPGLIEQLSFGFLASLNHVRAW